MRAADIIWYVLQGHRAAWVEPLVECDSGLQTLFGVASGPQTAFRVFFHVAGLLATFFVAGL
jgi:hypothetical protein